MAEILETLMLIVFSAGWYCSIGKMILTKKASGKSLSFVAAISSGYLCGALAKIAIFHETGELSALVYIYALNCVVTAVDGWLVIVLTRREKRLAAAILLQNNGRVARCDAPTLAWEG
jgi:uncharacterized membrane protein